MGMMRSLASLVGILLVVAATKAAAALPDALSAFFLVLCVVGYRELREQFLPVSSFLPPVVRSVFCFVCQS